MTEGLATGVVLALEEEEEEGVVVATVVPAPEDCCCGTKLDSYTQLLVLVC